MIACLSFDAMNCLASGGICVLHVYGTSKAAISLLSDAYSTVTVLLSTIVYQ